MKSNLFDKIMTILAILILLASTIFVLAKWDSLPEQIPIHYNFKGQPDAYGGTGSLVFSMVIDWTMLLTLTILSKFPHLWNTGVERTPVNAAVINRIVRDMLSVMELSLAALFGYTMIVPVIGIDMGVWFMPLFLGVIFGTIMVTVVRLIRNR